MLRFTSLAVCVAFLDVKRTRSFASAGDTAFEAFVCSICVCGTAKQLLLLFFACAHFKFKRNDLQSWRVLKNVFVSCLAGEEDDA